MSARRPHLIPQPSELVQPDHRAFDDAARLAQLTAIRLAAIGQQGLDDADPQRDDTLARLVHLVGFHRVAVVAGRRHAPQIGRILSTSGISRVAIRPPSLADVITTARGSWRKRPALWVLKRGLQ